MDTPLYRTNIKDAVLAYCACNRLTSPRIAYDPADQGEGHYVAQTHTLQLGSALLTMPDWAGYYALYMLLVGMHLALRPADFTPAAQRSARYRILPDGRCGRTDGKGDRRWVDLSHLHPADYWQAAAVNMPHMAEVAQRAEEEAYDMMTNDLMRDNLHSVCYLSRPHVRFDVEQYAAIFDAIDAALGAQ